MDPEHLFSDTASLADSFFSNYSAGGTKKVSKMMGRMKPRKQATVTNATTNEPEEESMWEKDRNIWADLGEAEEREKPVHIPKPVEEPVIHYTPIFEDDPMDIDEAIPQTVGAAPSTILNSFFSINPAEARQTTSAVSEQDTFVVAPIIKDTKLLDRTLLQGQDFDDLLSVGDLFKQPSKSQLQDAQLANELNDTENLLRDLDIRFNQTKEKKGPVTKKDLIQAKLQADQLARKKPLPQLRPLNDQELESKPSKIASFLKSYFNPKPKQEPETKAQNIESVSPVVALPSENAVESDTHAIEQPSSPKPSLEAPIFGSSISHLSSSRAHFDSPLKLPQPQLTPEKSLQPITDFDKLSYKVTKPHKPSTPLKRHYQVPKLANDVEDFDLEIIDEPTPLECIDFEIEKRAFFKPTKLEASPMKPRNNTPSKSNKLTDLNATLFSQMAEINRQEREGYDEGIAYSGDEEDLDDDSDEDLKEASSPSKPVDDTAVIAESANDLDELTHFIHGQVDDEPEAHTDTTNINRKKTQKSNPYLDDEAEVESSDDENPLSKLGTLLGETILDDDGFKRKQRGNQSDEDDEDDEDRKQHQLDRVMIDNRDIEDNTEEIMKLHNKLIQDDEQKNFQAFAEKAGLNDITDDEDSQSLGSDDTENEAEEDDNDMDNDSFVISEDETYLNSQPHTQYTDFANITVQEELEHKNRITVKTSNLDDDFDTIRQCLLPSLSSSASQRSNRPHHTINLEKYLEDDIDYLSTTDQFNNTNIETTEQITVNETMNSGLYFNQTKITIERSKYINYLQKRTQDFHTNKNSTANNMNYVPSKGRSATFIVRSKEDFEEDQFNNQFNNQLFKKFKK